MPDPQYTSPVLWKEGAIPPNAPAGHVWLYPDTGTMKQKDSSGTVTDLAGGGGGASALNDLTDVIITGAAENDMIYFNGTHWINSQVVIAGDELVFADGELLWTV
jgi:hypothetical protein